MASAHVPIVMSVELHFMPGKQALPPVPRQPSTQVLVVPSQTLPLVASPQSLSCTHWTHVPMVASVEVHSRPVGQPLPPTPRQPGPHVSVAVSQTVPLMGPPQSLSLVHWTHE